MAEDHLLDGALAHGLSVGGLAMLLVPTVGRWLGATPAGRLGRELARSGAVLLVGASLLHAVNGWIGATGALDLADLPAVLLETGYGRSVLWFAAASALLVAGWRRPGAASGSAALVVVGATWLGHAAVQGELSWLALTHAAHLAAVVGWLTGLCVLVVRPEQVAAARFSAVAPALVAAIVLTGAALAWVHLGRPLAAPQGSTGSAWAAPGSPPSVGSGPGSPPSAGSPAGSPPSAGSPAGSPPSAGAGPGSPASAGSTAGSPPSVGSGMGSPPSAGAAPPGSPASAGAAPGALRSAGSASGADRPDRAGWAYAVALAGKLAVAAAAGGLALANRRRVRRGAPSEGVLQAELLAAFVTALLGAALTQVEPP